jgi:hypothetical protein
MKLPARPRGLQHNFVLHPRYVNVPQVSVELNSPLNRVSNVLT